MRRLRGNCLGATCFHLAGTAVLLAAYGLAARTLLGQQSVAPQAPMTEQERIRIRQAKEWEKEGTELFSKGQFGGAALAFGKVYALYPDNLAASFNYGYTLETLGQFEKAIAPLQKVVAARAEDAQARFLLGVCYLGVGRLEDGVAELEKSLVTEPANIHALFQLAVAYHKLHQEAKADERLRRMAELSPDSAETFLYIARGRRMARTYEEAEKDIAHSLQLDPKNAEAHFERGVIEKGLHHFEEAEASFLEALRLSPEIPKYNLALAELYLTARHDPLAAIPYLQLAVQLNPDDAEANLELGNAYLKKNDAASAEKALERSIELDAGRSRAHYLLGMLLQRQGKKDEAAREFVAAEKLAAEEHRRFPKSETPEEEKTD